MTISTLVKILQGLNAPDIDVDMEDNDAQLAAITSVRVEYAGDGTPVSVIIL